MKWKKFTLTTTTEAVDYLGSMFDDIGIQGMEVEDNIPLTEAETKGMFIDILPELPPDEGVAKVSFAPDAIKQNIQAFIDEIVRVKPAVVKVNYIKSIYLSTTMGPSVKLVSSN